METNENNVWNRIQNTLSSPPENILLQFPAKSHDYCPFWSKDILFTTVPFSSSLGVVSSVDGGDDLCRFLFWALVIKLLRSRFVHCLRFPNHIWGIWGWCLFLFSLSLLVLGGRNLWWFSFQYYLYFRWFRSRGGLILLSKIKLSILQYILISTGWDYQSSSQWYLSTDNCAIDFIIRNSLKMVITGIFPSWNDWNQYETVPRYRLKQ